MVILLQNIAKKASAATAVAAAFVLFGCDLARSNSPRDAVAHCEVDKTSRAYAIAEKILASDDPKATVAIRPEIAGVYRNVRDVTEINKTDGLREQLGVSVYFFPGDYVPSNPLMQSFYLLNQTYGNNIVSLRAVHNAFERELDTLIERANKVGIFKVQKRHVKFLYMDLNSIVEARSYYNQLENSSIPRSLLALSSLSDQPASVQRLHVDAEDCALFRIRSKQSDLHVAVSSGSFTWKRCAVEASFTFMGLQGDVDVSSLYAFDTGRLTPEGKLVHDALHQLYSFQEKAKVRVSDGMSFDEVFCVVKKSFAGADLVDQSY